MWSAAILFHGNGWSVPSMIWLTPTDKFRYWINQRRRGTATAWLADRQQRRGGLPAALRKLAELRAGALVIGADPFLHQSARSNRSHAAVPPRTPRKSRRLILLGCTQSAALPRRRTRQARYQQLLPPPDPAAPQRTLANLDHQNLPWKRSGKTPRPKVDHLDPPNRPGQNLNGSSNLINGNDSMDFQVQA